MIPLFANEFGVNADGESVILTFTFEHPHSKEKTPVAIVSMPLSLGRKVLGPLVHKWNKIDQDRASQK